MCGIIALAIGYVTLRLRDGKVVIPSLGIAETVRLFFLNEKWVANGSKGLYRIPEFLGEWVSPKYYDYLYVVVVLVVLAVLFLNQSQGGNYILQRWQRRGSFHHQCVGSGL